MMAASSVLSLISLIVITLASSAASSSSVTNLTQTGYYSNTAGKTVFLKMFAPWFVELIVLSRSLFSLLSKLVLLIATPLHPVIVHFLKMFSSIFFSFQNTGAATVKPWLKTGKSWLQITKEMTIF